MSNDIVTRNDVMIVDDNPANLKLLQEMLAIQGYAVRSFPLGRLALAAVNRNPPDLILMDVNMPEMDGYETCQRLKADPHVADIPVIFLSALNETPDKVKAFHSGAADYITKPFQIEEVHSRVQTHLQLHNLHRALEQQNQRLEEAVAQRTKELSDANARLRILDESKTQFLTLISHELRTPLNGLLGVSEILLGTLSGGSSDKELGQMYQRSRRRILTILEDALLLGEIDIDALAFKTITLSLRGALEAAIEQNRDFSETRKVSLILHPPHSRPFEDDVIQGDKALVTKAIQALLETATKFAKAGTTVRLMREAAADGVQVVIESVGFTIPPAALGRFFDILAIAEALTPGGDLGLRPALAYRLLALFGASASVSNHGESAVRLTIFFRIATES